MNNDPITDDKLRELIETVRRRSFSMSFKVPLQKALGELLVSRLADKLLDERLSRIARVMTKP